MSKGVLVKIKPVLATSIIDTIYNSDQRQTANPFSRKAKTAAQDPYQNLHRANACPFPPIVLCPTIVFYQPKRQRYAPWKACYVCEDTASPIKNTVFHATIYYFRYH